MFHQIQKNQIPKRKKHNSQNSFAVEILMYSMFNDAIQIQYKEDLDKKEAKNFLKNTCEGDQFQ